MNAQCLWARYLPLGRKLCLLLLRVVAARRFASLRVLPRVLVIRMPSFRSFTAPPCANAQQMFAFTCTQVKDPHFVTAWSDGGGCRGRGPLPYLKRQGSEIRESHSLRAPPLLSGASISQRTDTVLAEVPCKYIPRQGNESFGLLRRQ